MREKTEESIREKSLSDSQSKSGTESKDFSQSEQQNLTESLDFARSEDFNKLYGKGVPAVPNLANLMAMFANRLLTETGISMVERAPCGMKCMFVPFLPPMCLCPKVKLELPKLPSLSYKPKLSSSVPTPSATLSTGASSSMSAKSSSNSVTSTSAGAQGNAGANVGPQATGQLASNTNANSNKLGGPKGSFGNGASPNSSST